MVKHVADSHGFEVAFGISSIQAEMNSGYTSLVECIDLSGSSQESIGKHPNDVVHATAADVAYTLQELGIEEGLPEADDVDVLDKGEGLYFVNDLGVQIHAHYVVGTGERRVSAESTLGVTGGNGLNLNVGH
jgi:hypothetical protein